MNTITNVTVYQTRDTFDVYSPGVKQFKQTAL